MGGLYNLLKNVVKKIPLAVFFYRKYRTFEAQQVFKREFKIFKSLNKDGRFPLKWENRYPCLNDRTGTTGFDRHYVYHTAWASRVLAETGPKEHIDISSSLYFVAIASAFVPIRFFDYRPADLHLTNLTSEPADLLSLPFKDGSVDSLSCMHVVEHVGLGRYGDSLDPDGDLKAIAELKRVIAKGGSLLFVVPIGKPRLMFNAHRIYSFDQIITYFSNFELKEFALIPDRAEEGGLLRHASKEQSDAQAYGCGCFWFKRRE